MTYYYFIISFRPFGGFQKRWKHFTKTYCFNSREERDNFIMEKYGKLIFKWPFDYSYFIDKK